MFFIYTAICDILFTHIHSTEGKRSDKQAAGSMYLKTPLILLKFHSW